MKKQLLIFVILALPAMLLVSCAKDDNSEGKVPEEGEVAVIQLSLAGTQPLGRGTSAPPTQAADNAINKIMVFVFNTGTQEINHIKSATTAEVATKVISVPATSGQRDIYIVSNFATADSANLANVTSVAGLKAVVSNIKSENEGNFRMIGKKLNQSIGTSTNNITVTVSRLVSRVTLSNITTAFTGGLSGMSLAIDSVYLLNVTGTMSYGDSSIVVTPSTVYNRTEPNFAFPIFDAYSTPVNINNTTPYTTNRANGNHFYIYSNAGSTFTNATKLIITGIINGMRTYYPIAINVAGNNYTPANPGITPNSLYSIAVSITGIGSTDPNTPVLSATLTITVVPQNWAVVINQNVTF